ncbi:unnamed protein product [Paramecium sonneborni]|uniref:Uncharacterized protein n=1 Tax=Paramecium sonneborni TaxID=65129 RepID=A0A8S1PZL0_9CILI|nr:unnamed protein product [Paramecium sonneborni]
MQIHLLLATLRTEKPNQKQQFLKILQDHILNCINEQSDQAWEYCNIANKKNINKLLKLYNFRDRDVFHQILTKLKPLVQIFDKMDNIRKRECKDKAIQKLLISLKFEAEKKNKALLINYVQIKILLKCYRRKQQNFKRKKQIK